MHDAQYRAMTSQAPLGTSYACVLKELLHVLDPMFRLHGRISILRFLQQNEGSKHITTGG